jgi:hypothetical protein
VPVLVVIIQGLAVMVSLRLLPSMFAAFVGQFHQS